MNGDRLLLYNVRSGKFFVRFDPFYSRKRGSGVKPVWTEMPERAWTTSVLGTVQRRRAELGADVKILTQTQARRITELRMLDNEYRAIEGKPSLLFAER